GNPIRHPAGGSARISLPDTAIKSPNTGAKFIISIKDNNNYKVSAIKLRYYNKGINNILIITEATISAEFREIINKFNSKF
ncbi:hypothetical protein B0T20DRAFT_340373, partial [Sordaria brevicollis]